MTNFDYLFRLRKDSLKVNRLTAALTKYAFGLMLMLMASGTAFGAVIFSEPLTSLPSGWTQTGCTFTTYAQMTQNTAVLTTPVYNLAGYTGVTLTYDVAKYGSGTDGPLTVQVSTDGGTTWTAASFTSPTPTSSSYQSASHTITTLSATTRFRWVTTSSPQSDKRLRTVALNGTAPTCTNPTISSATATQPTCTTTTGSIAVTASGTSLEYSKDGTNWQSSSTLSGLSAATYTIRVRSTTACVTTYGTNITINAAPTPASNVTNTTLTATGVEGTAFAGYTITGNNSPTSFSVTGTLPNGLSLNTTTGVISGTLGAGSAGSYSVTIASANTSCSGGITKTLTFTISAPPTSPAISFTPTTPTLAFGTVGVGYSSAQQSYGITGINLTNNITVTAPSGYLVSNTSGSGYATTAVYTQSGGNVSGTVYVIFQPSATGANNTTIANASTGATTQNVSVTGNGGTPTITNTPTSLAFGTVGVSFTSTQQSFSISGSYLTSNLTLTAPTGYAISTTSGSGYGSSVTLTPNATTGALASTTIYVVFQPTAATSYSGSITNSLGLTAQNVALTGTGSGPVVTLNSTSTLAFGSVNVGSTSSQLTYTVAGSYLTSNVVLTAPADFAISTVSGSGYGNTITLTPTSGSLATTTIYVVYQPTSAGAVSLNITNASTGATTVNKPVTGTGLPACTAPAAQATNLVFGTVTGTSIAGSFTATTANGYLVVASTSNSLSATPTNGTTYSAGASLGGGTIVQSSASTSFTASSLSSNTPYYFFVFAYNNTSCFGGPIYKSPALTGTATTLNVPIGLATWANQTSYTPTVATNIKGRALAPTSGVDFGSGVTNVNTAPNATYGINGNGFVANGTAINVAEYFQFSLGPNTGFDMDVDNVTLYANIQTSTASADIYYSTTSNFTNPVKLNSSALAITTTATTYTLTSSNATLPPTVSGGDTLYFRVYPYKVGSSSYYFRILSFGVNGFVNVGLPACVAPTTQATNLTFPTVTTSQINGSFTAASGGADGYLVVRSTSSTLSATPADGTTYTAGTSFGGGTIVQSGTATTFSNTSLSASTPYYYFVFAYNNTTCSNAPAYKTPALSGSATTLTPACVAPNQATTLTFPTVTTSQINGQFNGASGGASGYLVVRSSNSTLSANPVDGSTYTAGASLGGGTVVQAGTGLTFSVTSLPASTTYYFFVFAYNNTSCVGGPVYKTPSLSGFQATATPCAAPTAQATNLVLSGVQAQQVSGSFTAAGADGYLVVASTSSTLSANPVSATSYVAGATLGGGTVVQSSSSTTFTATGLNPSTQYYFFVIAYNNTGCYGGPLYRTPALLNNATTLTSPYANLDNFNRTDNDAVGNGWTTETETDPHIVRVENNMLYMYRDAGQAGQNGNEFITRDVSSLYATTYSRANGKLVWLFNLRATRSSPSGFAASNYGTAFILGSDQSDITNSAAKGYAVILGGQGSPYPLSLVKFSTGLAVNSFTNIISWNHGSETSYFSVEVTFDPTTNTWELFGRNDGSSFADPTTITPAQSRGTAVESSLANTNLPYLGAYWKRFTGGTSYTEYAVFDNFWRPTAQALPLAFPVTGGSNCTSTTVGISSSELNVNYQLLLNGGNVGSPVAGTGSAISFGAQTVAGTYTIIGTNGAGSTTMTGTATVKSTPSAFTVTGGTQCSGTLAVGLSGSETGVNYQLKRNSVNQGSTVSGTGNALAFTNQTITGSTPYVFTVLATDATSGCTTTQTGSATLNPNPTAFTVTGGTNCNSTTVSLNSSLIGTNYQLQLDGNDVGAPFVGNNSPFSFGAQTVVGTYTIVATIAATGCTATMNGSAAVNPNPGAVSVTPPSATVNHGGSGVALTASASGAATYTWSPATGLSATTGATVTANPTANTTYTVTASTSNGCTATNTVIVTYVPCTNPVWTGTTSTDWFTTSNWSCNVVPTSTSVVTIPSSVTNFPEVSGAPLHASAAVKDITIQAGAKVTVLGTNNVNLEVYGNFTNNGVASMGGGKVILKGTTPQNISGSSIFRNLEINNTQGITIASGSSNGQLVNGTLTLAKGTLATNSNLTIGSDASGAGLIDNFSTGNTGTIAGTLTVQRYAVNPNTSFFYIGAPVSGATVADWNADFANNPLNGAVNGSHVIPTASCSVTNVAANSPYGGLFTYKENQVTTCALQGWNTLFSGAIAQGQGFAARVPNGTMVDLTGSFNSSNVTTGALTKSVTNTTQSVGFNLVANPYVAPLDWATVVAGNPTVDGAAYLYQNQGTFAGSYLAFNSIVSNTQIGSSEAFFVHVSSLASTTMTFTGAMRTTGLNSFLRMAKPYDNKLTLDITGSGMSDKATIAFGSNFTESFDREFDAHKMMSTDGYPSLYVTEGADQYAIYAQPSVTQAQHVPVAFVPGADGMYTIKASDLGTFDANTTIILEDMKLHTTQDLVANSNYTFMAQQNDNAARFIVHFAPVDKTTSTITTAERNTIISANGNDITIIFGSSLKGKVNVDVIDLMGRKVTETATIDAMQNRYDIHMGDVAAGCYFVRVSGEGFEKAEKVILGNVK